MEYFVKEGRNVEIYQAKELKPGQLSFLSNPLALQIIKELSKQPQCAMDVSRKIGELPQKVYYYMKKMEEAGIIKLVKKEERVGAIAKVYETVAPYVSLKLYDAEPIRSKRLKIKETEILHPFVLNGKLNSLIVVGSPDPHGRFAAQASDGYAAIDLALFLGSFIENPGMNYKLDTQIRDEDLKKNLILIGGPKSNILVDRINAHLPIYFDEKNEWTITSKITGKKYTEDEIGVVVKMPSPFESKKWILFASGRRFKGTRASIIAIVKHSRLLSKGNNYKNGIARVVRGIDRDSDGIIDDIEFLE